MALAFIEAIIAEGTGSAVTTASYTIAADNVAALVAGSNNNGAGHTHAITGGGTYSQKVNQATQPSCASAHWLYTSGGLSAITTTVTDTLGGGSGISVTITEWSGAETTFGGATASSNSASGASTVTFTVEANSRVIGGASDWAQRGNFTAGTGETLDNTHNLAGDYSAGQWHSTSDTGAGSYTSDGGGSSTRQHNTVAMEIRVRAGAAAATPSDDEMNQGGIAAMVAGAW